MSPAYHLINFFILIEQMILLFNAVTELAYKEIEMIGFSDNF